MDTALLEKAVSAAMVEKDGRKTIACETAQEIARNLKVDAKVVGGFCNAHKIRIVACNLGCFK